MKNLFKKTSAILIAAVMVLAMASTAFADGNSATIKLTNFSTAKTLKYMQIIEPDQNQPTGWKFSNSAAKDAFTGVTGKDAQTTLWMLILNKDSNARKNNKLNIPDDIKAIKDSEIDSALSTIKSNTSAPWNTATKKTDMSVSAAGVYAFDAEEDGYTYKVATAYVGFGTYEITPTLQNTEVVAKKSETIITKTVNDPDKAVAIGDTVEYTITTNVPYIDANNTTGRSFKITDEIEGASYILENNKVKGIITLSTDPVTTVNADINPSANGKSFEINLDSLVNDRNNPYAGLEVTVKYKAKITAVTAKNTAKGHKSGIEYGGTNDKVDLYTGTIVLTKTDASNDGKKLANAEFTVHKVTTTDNEKNVGTALKFDYNEETGIYTYNPDSTRENATTVITNANGKITVEGLDKGEYHFTETKAPNGYSINEDGANINLTFEGDVATANFTQNGNLKDSRLSSLPSTGGMGTYLFTIIGVVVMAGAAGAFFISRRKGSEE